MKIGILGAGMVGTTLGTKLVQVGHHVTLGSRASNNEAGTKWAAPLGERACTGTFQDAAAFGEILLDCTNGEHSLAALRQAGAANLARKILIHVSNPLDFSKGMPPTLTVCNTDSLGEQVQREFPDARVVKALNTINCDIMIQPDRVPGVHHVPICGNDAAAKAEVTKLLGSWFGWKPASILDLGDITASRSMEMFVPLWLRLFTTFGNPHFNIQIVRGK